MPACRIAKAIPWFRMKGKLAILAALAGLLSPRAGAQEGATAARRGGAEITPAPQPDAEVFKKFDKDRDGKLSESELAAWKAAREDALRKQILAKYDADKDGRLSEEETKKMQSEIPRRGDPAHFQPSADALKKYDKDGNGVLSADERRAWSQARQKEMLDKFDANRDGKLTGEEAARMREDFRKQREERAKSEAAKPAAANPGEQKAGEKKSDQPGPPGSEHR